MSNARFAQGEIRNRLLLGIDHLKVPEKALINRAMALAEDVHQGHYRLQFKDNPYERINFIIHPMRVALVMTEELRIRHKEPVGAALLHDVVEDSNWQISTHDLEKRFGRNIALIVSILTRPAPDPKIAREQQNKTYYDRIAKANVPARLIKLAERLDNLRDMSDALEAQPPETVAAQHVANIQQYLIETWKVFVPIAQGTNEYLYLELLEICQKMERKLALELARL